MKTKRAAADIFITIVGNMIFALAIHSFTAPNHIAPGGLTGISTILNYMFNIPIGLSTFVLNLPLFIIGYKSFGRTFILKTLFSLIIFSLSVDVLFQKVPVYEGDPLLGGLFGGAIMGFGIGLVILRGGSTGGVDILSLDIQKKSPSVPLGTIFLMFDVVVILLSMLVFKNFESGLYAFISIFVYSKVIDTVMYGTHSGKQAFIISDHNDRIAAHILEKMGRGVTKLKGAGAYTGQEKNVLLLVSGKREFYELKRTINEIDKNAFIIVNDVTEVFGMGFRPMA